jgi:hypothetical protein
VTTKTTVDSSREDAIDMTQQEGKARLVIKDQLRINRELTKENEDYKMGMLAIEKEEADGANINREEQRISEIAVETKNAKKKASEEAKKNKSPKKSRKISVQFPNRNYKKIGGTAKGKKMRKAQSRRRALVAYEYPSSEDEEMIDNEGDNEDDEQPEPDKDTVFHDFDPEEEEEEQEEVHVEATDDDKVQPDDEADIIQEDKEIEWDIKVDTSKEYSTSCPTKNGDEMEKILGVVNHRKQKGMDAELLAIFQNGERAWSSKSNIWTDGKKFYKTYLEKNDIDIMELQVEDKKDNYFRNKEQKKKAAVAGKKVRLLGDHIPCQLIMLTLCILFLFG